jgi:uncharacterized protein
VVPTTSLPQGVAAALTFEPGQDADANAQRMESAVTSVRTVEVTVAAGARRADGITVQQGQAIALVDGRLVAAEEGLEAALLAGLRTGEAAEAGLVTLYGGEGVNAEALERMAGRVREAFEGVEVEAVEGGQPLYPYIASIEA